MIAVIDYDAGNIKSVEFVSKESAWQEQLNTMEEAQAEFFTQISSDIPLPNAYKVTVENLDQFDETVSKLKQLQHVDTIRENKNLAKKLVALRQGITVVAIVIIAVLFLISVFIISNTIKLTVYSRRLEISIMKSVGATNSFVRWPFLIEGMIIGLISAIVSTGAIAILYETAQALVYQIVPIDFIPINNVIWITGGLFAIAGIVIGFFGSFISIRKYLKMEGNEILGW